MARTEAFYRSIFQELADEYAQTKFHDFVREHTSLTTIGDELLTSGQITGYNVSVNQARHKHHLDLTTRAPRVFYVNEIGNVEHFTQLLAGMEDEAIITPDQVEVGVRGSKYLWEYEVGETEVVQALEAVVSFNPEGSQSSDPKVVLYKAVQILDYLNARTYKGRPGALPCSWVIPDIRISSALGLALCTVVPYLSRVVLNYQQTETAQILVLTGKQRLPVPGWESAEVAIAEQLAEFVSGD